MEIILIHWFFLALMAVKSEGLVSEEIMKIILESCYKTEKSSNPTVIFGQFNKYIDEVSIIRINGSLSFEHFRKYQPLKFKASNVVLIEDSPEKLALDLQLLEKTQLWNHMVPFFIVGKDTEACKNSKNILAIMWKMEILHSVYICSESINNTSALYTLNPMTNYAPLPWRRIGVVNYLNVYRQIFDASISCAHLTYDKTKNLNGHTITGVSWEKSNENWELGRNYFEDSAQNPLVSFRALRALIIALNATGRLEVEVEQLSTINRCGEGTTDIMLPAYTLGSFLGEPALFPHLTTDMIAIVKLGAEVSTLEKIRRLWSPPVLIAAAVALAILFLILLVINRNFGVALLDVTRLLIYSAIQTDTSYQSFRIYFTTMLIFIVISNGVFQGKIAAFLTTREKENTIKSIGELIELGYEMYAPYGASSFAQKGCPQCEFKEVSANECIQFVLNGSNNVCAMAKRNYEAYYIHLPLDYVGESFNGEYEQFKCRRNWPLHTRMNNLMMQLIESGLINLWDSQNSGLQRAKRQATEAEWASAQYRPVRLRKLTFAFHLLAAGLFISTMFFFLELLWTRLCNP